MKCWRKAKQKEKKGEVGKLIEIVGERMNKAKGQSIKHHYRKEEFKRLRSKIKDKM